MTNSNGTEGATHTSASSRPLARSPGGLFSWSHLTRNAAAAVSPRSAPCCHIASKKVERVSPILARVNTSFDSNTAHWSEWSIASLIIMSRRRTFTKRQFGSLLTVRAPKIRNPRPPNARITLMPSGFSTPCVGSSTNAVTS